MEGSNHNERSFEVKLTFNHKDFEEEFKNYCWKKIETICYFEGGSTEETNDYYWITLKNKDALMELIKFTDDEISQMYLCVDDLWGECMNNNLPFGRSTWESCIQMATGYKNGFETDHSDLDDFRSYMDSDLKFYIEWFGFLEEKLDILRDYISLNDNWEKEVCGNIEEYYVNIISNKFLKIYYSPYTEIGKRRFNKECDALGCFD